MPAGLVVPVSGPYTGTLQSAVSGGARSLGTQNDDGFVLLGAFTGQEVNLSDAYGMTLVEAIWRGLNWRLRLRGLEWNKPGILLAINAFGSSDSPTATLTPVLRNIGDRYSNYDASLVLTALLPNPPTTPQTLTALNTVVAPQSNVEYIMTSKVREAPFEFVLLPYNTTVGSLSNVNLAFTTT